jgi:WhiB family redox-sensing transcriptional regulator
MSTQTAVRKALPPHPQQTGVPACAGADVSLFFPEQGHSEGAALATALCARCEVRRACLDYAIAIREQYGIWGGHTPGGRRTARRAGTGVAR